MSAKELVESVVKNLPDDVTVDDILYHIHVADLVHRRSKEADEALALGVDEALRQGKLVSQEAVRERFKRWASE